eukprot:scaffold182_cov350-Prasinococcus_capsulatus_cf.AAC.22
MRAIVSSLLTTIWLVLRSFSRRTRLLGTRAPITAKSPLPISTQRCNFRCTSASHAALVSCEYAAHLVAGDSWLFLTGVLSPGRRRRTRICESTYSSNSRLRAAGSNEQHRHKWGRRAPQHTSAGRESKLTQHMTGRTTATALTGMACSSEGTTNYTPRSELPPPICVRLHALRALP